MAWVDPTRGARTRTGEDSRVRRALESLGKWSKATTDTLTADVATLTSQVAALSALPVGTLAPSILTTAPTDWVLCYGQTIASADSAYPDLWAVVNSAFKSGTSLVVPDLRGRAPFGLDNMGGSDAGRLAASNTFGTTGGAETVTLTASESGTTAHGHTLTNANHKHTPNAIAEFIKQGSTGLAIGDLGGGTFDVDTVADTSNPTTTMSVATSTAASASSAHNNMPPYILLNWILKVL